jgi:hypothetical protein
VSNRGFNLDTRAAVLLNVFEVPFVPAERYLTNLYTCIFQPNVNAAIRNRVGLGSMSEPIAKRISVPKPSHFQAVALPFHALSF